MAFGKKSSSQTSAPEIKKRGEGVCSCPSLLFPLRQIQYQNSVSSAYLFPRITQSPIDKKNVDDVAKPVIWWIFLL